MLILEIAAGSNDCLVLNWEPALLVLAGGDLFEVQILHGLQLKQLRVELRAYLRLDKLKEPMSACFLYFGLVLGRCQICLGRWCRVAGVADGNLWDSGSEDARVARHLSILNVVVNSSKVQVYKLNASMKVS